MSDTEPRGSDAEIVALLRACGMEEANLDDGVRNVRKIVEVKKTAARDTEPLDLDAWVRVARTLHDRADAICADRDGDLNQVDELLAAEASVEALIAEVRRLREEVLVHRYILESGRCYFAGKASGEVGEWWLRQINRSFADPKEGDVEKARDWFESKGEAA